MRHLLLVFAALTLVGCDNYVDEIYLVENSCSYTQQYIETTENRVVARGISAQFPVRVSVYKCRSSTVLSKVIINHE